MLDFGWSELLLIGIVALIVVGPEDLPAMFRTLGRFTAKARSMARDFSRAMEDAARETGVQDVASDLRKATSPRALGLDALQRAADKFEKWDPKTPALQPVTTDPVSDPASPAAPDTASAGQTLLNTGAPSVELPPVAAEAGAEPAVPQATPIIAATTRKRRAPVAAVKPAETDAVKTAAVKPAAVKRAKAAAAEAGAAPGKSGTGAKAAAKPAAVGKPAAKKPAKPVPEKPLGEAAPAKPAARRRVKAAETETAAMPAPKGDA